MKSAKHMILPLAAGLLMTACALKSNIPPATTYALRAVDMPDAVAGTYAHDKTRVLQVARPILPPGFDTDRIALYREGGRKLDYYAAARWPDIFDTVMQDFIARTGAALFPEMIVTTAFQPAQSDARLQIKVNDFQPVYRGGPDSAPEIVVGLEFTLTTIGDERIIDSFVLTQRRQAVENRLDVIADDMNNMLHAMVSEAFARLAPHVKATGEKEGRRKAPAKRS